MRRHEAVTAGMVTVLLAVALAAGAGDGAPVRVTDYLGTVWGIAVGVEENGRVHIVWTGQRSSDTTFTAFYASSSDGSSFPSYQVLDTGDAFDPVVVVDDAHARVHLVYRSNSNGIIHRTVSGGVVSAPVVVDVTGVIRPALAVDPSSGTAFLVWRKWDGAFTTQTARYARWNGASWSTPVVPVAGGALWDTIAASPSGAVMLAGVLGDANGNSLIARSALAADGLSFASPVPVAGAHPWPEEDDTATVVYHHGDGSFHLAANHLLWPGSSETYHWVWSGSAWSGPDNLSQSATDSWSTGEFLGSVAAVPHLVVSWLESGDTGALLARTWHDGTLSPVDDLSPYLSDAGVLIGSGSLSRCLGADGSLHLALGEAAYDYQEVYYVAFPALGSIFVDGFEAGASSAWSFTQP